LLHPLTRKPEQVARVSPAEAGALESCRSSAKLRVRDRPLHFSSVACATCAAYGRKQLRRQADVLGQVCALDVEEA
jgi:hypothetical protein